MDSITKEKDATNVNNVSEWKPFDITYNEKTDSTSVTYNISITEKFGGQPEDVQIVQTLSDFSRINISQISRQIGAISFDLLMDNYDNQPYVQDAAAFVQILSQIIDGYTVFLETLDRYKPKAVQTAESQPSERADDLETLARQISEILHNPALPTQIYNALGEEISEIKLDMHSPENVLHNLKELQKAS